MTRATQTLLLAITGALLLRMAAGDAYLRYVNSWMRWPLIACGVLLVVLALADLWREQGSQDQGRDAHVPRAAWLLFAPSLVFFLIAPPALGAHFAERAPSAAVPIEEAGEVPLPPLPDVDAVPLMLDDVLFRAAYDDGATLADRRLELTGFVSRDDSGTWYVTRFGINCCAADATVVRIAASGVEPPPDDQWVRVVARHVPGTGDGGVDPPEVTVEEIEFMEPPRNQYR